MFQFQQKVIAHHITKSKLTSLEVKKLEVVVCSLLSDAKDLGGIPRAVRCISGGHYSSVFSFGKGKVLRVEHDNEDYGGFSGYESWIERVVLKTRSKHVAKVYFHGKVSYADHDGDERQIMITIMEKLYKVGHMSGERHRDIRNAMEGFMRRGEKFTAPKSVKEPRFTKRALTLLSNLAVDGDVEINDLHDENYMVRRSDNRLVITDPSS